MPCTLTRTTFKKITTETSPAFPVLALFLSTLNPSSASISCNNTTLQHAQPLVCHLPLFQHPLSVPNFSHAKSFSPVLIHSPDPYSPPFHLLPCTFLAQSSLFILVTCQTISRWHMLSNNKNTTIPTTTMPPLQHHQDNTHTTTMPQHTPLTYLCLSIS